MWQHAGRMRIRTRLLLLVCVLLIPALLAAGVGVAYIYRQVQESNYASMQETARALALALDQDLQRRRAILETLADSSSLQRGELQPFHAYAAAVAKHNQATIILSDLDGAQLLNTRVPPGRPLPRMLAMEREMRARFGNEAVLVSDVYLPPQGLGPHSFAIQVPVRRAGRVEQFLSMAAFTAQMQELLAAQRLPQGWHGTIADRRGIVAARSLEPEKFVGQPLRDSLRQRLAVETEGRQAGLSLAGVPSTVFFSRAPFSGWTFVLSVPNSALYAPGTRAMLLLGVISFLLLGIGLAGALALARRIAGRIEALREAAHALGRGEAMQAPRTGTVELDEVGDAMSDASRRLRDAKAELERQVAQAIARFEQSQHALIQAQKLEALGRLTGGIAHDFNNVLQTLSAALHALRYAPPQTQADLVARCERAVSRGTELARQLMAFGRVQEVRVETIDTAARLVDALPLLEGALPANVRLDYELAPGLWPVTVDPAQLELALLNLVINARDAMPAGGRIRLAAENTTVSRPQGDLPPGEYVALALSDTGEGMTPEVMARALDPFYTTKGVGKGSGMGLPQAYGFARQSGGTLELDSAPGRGTTVTLLLPRARAPVSAGAPADVTAALPTVNAKVLVVEDDEHVRETVSAALRTAGFDIHTASSGDEAMHRIESGEAFDAVLSDVVMPGNLSGIELARRLRMRHPGVGVVLATGYSDRAVDVPGVRALAKPYDIRQVVEALRVALGRASA